MKGQNKPIVPILEPETKEEPSTQNTSESEPAPAPESTPISETKQEDQPTILEVTEPKPILIVEEKAPVPEPVLIIEEPTPKEEPVVEEPVEEDLKVEPEVDYVFDLLDDVTILPSETEEGAVMIVADKNAHKKDEKKYSVVHATVYSNDTLADRFQSFWS